MDLVGREARGTAKHPAVHRSVPDTKSGPANRAKCAKTEKPCQREGTEKWTERVGSQKVQRLSLGSVSGMYLSFSFLLQSEKSLPLSLWVN